MILSYFQTAPCSIMSKVNLLGHATSENLRGCKLASIDLISIYKKSNPVLDEAARIMLQMKSTKSSIYSRLREPILDPYVETFQGRDYWDRKANLSRTKIAQGIMHQKRSTTSNTTVGNEAKISLESSVHSLSSP